MTTVYTLSQASASLQIVPERGGIITHWQIADQDILYLDQERFADPSLSVRGGIPILFPICGNLPNNEFHYQGQTYTLKQHGFARDMAWQVKQQTENHLVLALTDTPETLAHYPFPFALELTYTLAATALTIQAHLQNPGATAIPFSLGFHPYFLAPDKTNLGLDIPATSLIDQKTQISHPFAGTFDWAAPELDLAFPALSHPQVHMHNRAIGQHLTLTFSPDYATFVFWTLAGKEYVCLEPWTAPRNALNTGDHLLLVEPGGAWSSEFQLAVTLPH